MIAKLKDEEIHQLWSESELFSALLICEGLHKINEVIDAVNLISAHNEKKPYRPPCQMCGKESCDCLAQYNPKKEPKEEPIFMQAIHKNSKEDVCPMCKGEGLAPHIFSEPKCPTCNGTGRSSKIKSLETEIGYWKTASIKDCEIKNKLSEKIKKYKEALKAIMHQHPEGYMCKITEIAKEALGEE